MSYTDLDPDYYERKQCMVEVGADYDYTMQFAPPEYTTPLNVDCLKDADYRADLRWPADGRPFSYPPCYETKADPVPVYDSESSKWVDVPFHVAWLFYGLFVFMGQLLVFGFSTTIFHWPLGVYVMWGILNLLALPFLSYWWTKHARDRHYGKVDRHVERTR